MKKKTLGIYGGLLITGAVAAIAISRLLGGHDELNRVNNVPTIVKQTPAATPTPVQPISTIEKTTLPYPQLKGALHELERLDREVYGRMTDYYQNHAKEKVDLVSGEGCGPTAGFESPSGRLYGELLVNFLRLADQYCSSITAPRHASTDDFYFFDSGLATYSYSTRAQETWQIFVEDLKGHVEDYSHTSLKSHVVFWDKEKGYYQGSLSGYNIIGDDSYVVFDRGTWDYEDSFWSFFLKGRSILYMRIYQNKNHPFVTEEQFLRIVNRQYSAILDLLNQFK